MSTIFANKTLLITGGTGSFGNAVLDRFLKTDIGEIRIFSRDELKQDNMRHFYQREFPEYSDKIKFYIGDVRDIQSVKNAMHDVDYIFHAAALKQVPSCEFFPIEAVKTNVLGTENVLTAAIEAGVWQCDVFQGIRDPAVYQSDQGRKRTDRDRADHDPFHYESGGGCGAGCLCFPECRERRHHGAKGAGVHH